MKEIWKDIKEYEGYYKISNLGVVKSLARNVYDKDGIFQRAKKENIKKQNLSTDKYYLVTLSRDGKNKTISVHRLIAQTFIDNPNNYEEVNHIDTNRVNNSIENLEWCTHQQNIKHSADLGKYKGRIGKLNSNYGNKKLYYYYLENPEEIKKLARKGKQNGRCVETKIVNINTKEEIYFDYLRECSGWFKDNFDISVTISTIHQHLIKARNENKEYNGYMIF